MFKKVLFITLVFIITSSSSYSSDFKEIKLYFPNESSVNTVSLSFDGKIYDEKFHYKYITKRVRKKEATDIELALFTMIETYKHSTDKKDILEIWSPSEKDNIEEKFSNKNLIKKNKAFYKNLIDTKLVAAMMYADVTLVFVTHSITNSKFEPFMQVYPMVKHKESLLLTNRLKKDPFFVSFSSLVGEHILKYEQ